MADTIITNSPDKNNGDNGSTAGWIVALVIIAAVVVGGIMLYQNGFFRAAAPSTDSTNINITVPEQTPPATETNPPADEPLP